MNDTKRAAQQLAAITDNMVGLFTDYCERAASPLLVSMLTEFHEHRLDLVLTAHITESGTDFICCALPVGGGLVRLFDVHEIPGEQSGGVH